MITTMISAMITAMRPVIIPMIIPMIIPVVVPMLIAARPPPVLPGRRLLRALPGAALPLQIFARAQLPCDLLLALQLMQLQLVAQPVRSGLLTGRRLSVDRRRERRLWRGLRRRLISV